MGNNCYQSIGERTVFEGAASMEESRIRVGVLIRFACLSVAAATVYAQGTTFTYQGKLDQNGQPTSGATDFTFKLFGVASGGTQLGPTVTRNGVNVANGLFTVPLDFGAQFDGSARWVEIAVQGATLTPRQAVTAAPFALHALSGPGGTGPWQTNGSSVFYNGGNVGIGTSSPGFPLSFPDIAGDKISLTGSTAAGVFDGFGAQGGVFQMFSATVNNDILFGYGRSSAFSENVRFKGNGRVGMGTSDPLAHLHVAGSSGLLNSGIYVRADTGTAILSETYAAGQHAAIAGSAHNPAGWGGSFRHFGGGSALVVQGGNGAIHFNGDIVVDGGADGTFKILNSGREFLFQNDGGLSVRYLTIRGGSDLAEAFAVSPADVIESAEPVPSACPAPGMVVAIDSDNPGQLEVAAIEYDTKVAGVISGANNLSAGMVMKAEGDNMADGEHPVALTGRVWCYADAAFGQIGPGDRLTTSATPGHAMRVSDESRAAGAVIGKAMTSLNEGRGFVLVLVQPQ